MPYTNTHTHSFHSISPPVHLKQRTGHTCLDGTGCCCECLDSEALDFAQALSNCFPVLYAVCPKPTTHSRLTITVVGLLTPSWPPKPSSTSNLSAATRSRLDVWRLPSYFRHFQHHAAQLAGLSEKEAHRNIATFCLWPLQLTSVRHELQGRRWGDILEH